MLTVAGTCSLGGKQPSSKERSSHEINPRPDDHVALSDESLIAWGRVTEDTEVRRHAIFTAALALLLSGSITTAQAQDIKFVSLTDFASLQNRIDELEGRLASYDNLGDGAQKYDDVCGSCQKGKGNCGCGPSWYAGYEMTVLQTYINDQVSGPGYDDAYGVGHRFIVGRDGGAGMGLRARYWMFNHGKDGLGALAGEAIRFDVDVLDIEATLNEQMCNWDVMVSGGIRYGRFEFMDVNSGAVGTYEGLGPNATYFVSKGGGGSSFGSFFCWRWAFSNFVDFGLRGCAFRA